MQFPRYEFVIPCEHERCPTRRLWWHRPAPSTRPQEPLPAARRATRRREAPPALAIHEYLELEFAVEDRR